MNDPIVRWTAVAGATVAAFLGILGFEVGRAGAGGDPAIPAARAAAAAQDVTPLAPAQELPPLTTRQS